MTTTAVNEPESLGWGSMRVMLSPGHLLVAREGSGLLVADPEGAAQEAVTDRLLDLCAGTTGGPPPAGRELVRAAAALLTGSASDEVPALALVAVEDDDLLVTLTRGMRLAVTDATGAVDVIDAEDSVLPVSRVLASGAGTVALGPDPETLEVDRRSNLSGGVVRAGGLVLEPGNRAAGPRPPAETLVDLVPPPPPDEAVAPPTFVTFPLHDTESEGDQSPPAQRGPAPDPTPADEPVAQPVAQPVETGELDEGPDAGPEADAALPEDPRSPDAEQPGVRVRGIVCSRGHFNPPDARFCERCGISTVHQTHSLVTGLRPPLGVLVLDDGTVHTLSGDVVIGRAPEEAEDVRSGRCVPLALDDPELSVSRTHARLVLDGWEVRVEDAGSVNGTFLAEAGSEDWSQLEAGRPTTITPGARLRLGSRVLAFESHHRV